MQGNPRALGHGLPTGKGQATIFMQHAVHIAKSGDRVGGIVFDDEFTLDYFNELLVGFIELGDVAMVGMMTRTSSAGSAAATLRYSRPDVGLPCCM